MFKFMYCKNGVPSMSKVWTNVANATVTYILITHADKLPWEAVFAYLVIVGGYEIGKQYVAAKITQLGVSDVSNSSTDK